MDAGVFLQAQTWLTPGTNSPPPPDTHLPLTTKTRFHICLEEQHIPAAAAGTTDTPWHGLSHPSAVNIRLRLPDGSCKATLDATVLCTTQQQQQQQQDGSPEAAALHICWHGQTFAVKHQHIHKVVCSSDIAAAAASLQPQHVTACLIAPAVPQGAQQPQYAHVAWVSLITRHVCLDIMVQDSSDHVQQLARVVDALHLTAPCCTQQQQRPSAGATSAPASSSSAPPTSGLNLQLSTSTPTPGEALALPPLEINAFLTAAHCEAQLVQMLLDSQAASASDSGPAAPAAAVAAVQQSREQHVLDAVANLHASQHGCVRVQPVNGAGRCVLA